MRHLFVICIFVSNNQNNNNMVNDNKERKFTLRLGVEESNMLQSLREITGEKTDSGAIKFIIRNYENLTLRYAAEMNKNKNLKIESSDQKRSVSHFLNSLENLKSLLD